MMGWEDRCPDDDYFDEMGYRCSRSSVGSELVELAFDSVLRQTDKAWHIRFPMKKDLTNDELWFPKSQCELEEDKQRIWVPRWLVDEKEVEDYEV